MIAAENQFHSPAHYKRYLFAVSLAEQINSYIDKGYIVIEDNEVVKGRFVFVSGTDNYPVIGLRDGNCTLDYICGTYNDNNQTYIEYNKTKIKEVFSRFKIVNPRYIQSVKYKKGG